MRIIIKNFYPFEKQKRSSLQGSMHIELPDLGIEIKNVHVIQNKKSFLFLIPRWRGIDKNTGDVVFYPLLSFSEKEIQKDFIQSLRNVGHKYLNHVMKKGGLKSPPYEFENINEHSKNETSKSRSISPKQSYPRK
jgi:hypothetical protein